MSYSKKELTEYRILRSDEALIEAKELFVNKHFNTAISRCYYSCFYILLAYMAKENISASTHNGVKTKFNQLLVKEGIISEDLAVFFNQLFNMRQKSDYQDFFSFEELTAEEVIEKTELFIENVELTDGVEPDAVDINEFYDKDITQLRDPATFNFDPEYAYLVDIDKAEIVLEKGGKLVANIPIRTFPLHRVKQYFPKESEFFDD